jgi:hypothetical protein
MSRIDDFTDSILRECELFDSYPIDLDNLISILDIIIEYGEYDYTSRYENKILYLKNNISRVDKGVALGYALLYPDEKYYSRYGLTSMTSICRDFSYGILMPERLYYRFCREYSMNDKIDLNKLSKKFDMTIDQIIYRGRRLGVLDWN